MKDNPRELHKKNSYLVEDKENLYLNHQYQPTIKSWRFIGYRCSSCGQSLRQVGNIIKHNDLCRVLNNKVYKKKEANKETDD